MRNLLDWLLAKDSGTNLTEQPQAIVHGNYPMHEDKIPLQPLKVMVPKSKLPHLNPREDLLNQYILQPRQRASTQKWKPPATPVFSPPPSSKTIMPSREVSNMPKTSPPASNGKPLFGLTPSSSLLGDKAIGEAHTRAASAKTLDELKHLMETFEACSLKNLAQNTVFGDGNPQAEVMLIGEAPGAEEDLQGRPFVGLSGKLLDKMFAAIGFDRTSLYISNIVPWRPPGNRQPSTTEISLCLPFITRHIELIRPKIIVLVGGTSSKALLNRADGIMRLRNQWFDYMSPGLDSPIKALATFHPAYLLRSPGQKREVWRDMINISQTLAAMQLQQKPSPDEFRETL